MCELHFQNLNPAAAGYVSPELCAALPMHACESEESTAEICCVAVPLAENGQVKAAISVTTPKFRYTDEKKQQITQLLLKKRQLIEESCRIQNCRLVF